MSRCVPIQTNVNTDTTFFLPAGAPVPPPPGIGYSTITAANYVSTADLVVSSINNFTPTLYSGLSSLTAATSVTSGDVFASSVNGVAYIPLTNYTVSSLSVSSTGALSTPQITASSIGGQQYPLPQTPNIIVSTLTAATNISTTIAEINQVNSAPFVSTFPALTIPPDLIVSSFTASTITVPQLSLDNVSTGSLVFTAISTPTVSTTTINSSPPPAYYPGYIYGGGSGPVALGISTSVDILANYGPAIMSTLLPSYTVIGTTTLPGFPSSIPGILPTGISSFVIIVPAGVGIGSPWRYNTLLISNSKPVV
jgi:hypothetical protein